MSGFFGRLRNAASYLPGVGRFLAPAPAPQVNATRRNTPAPAAMAARVQHNTRNNNVVRRNANAPVSVLAAVPARRELPHLGMSPEEYGRLGDQMRDLLAAAPAPAPAPEMAAAAAAPAPAPAPEMAAAAAAPAAPIQNRIARMLANQNLQAQHMERLRAGPPDRARFWNGREVDKYYKQIYPGPSGQHILNRGGSRQRRKNRRGQSACSRRRRNSCRRNTRRNTRR
jgi:hypothetical protein